MIPRSHPLASVREAYNAVFVEAASAGQLMFYGRGAGGAPTASAVLGDLVAVARNAAAGRARRRRVVLRRPARAAHGRGRHALPHQPRRGRQGRCARGRRQRLRRSRRLDPHRPPGGPRRRRALVVVTHTATDAALQAVVEQLRGLDSVRAVASVMRVEGTAVDTSWDCADRGDDGRLARSDRAVPRPAARHAPRRPSSRCSRARRRWSRRAPVRARSAPRSGSRSRARTPPGPSRTAA